MELPEFLCEWPYGEIMLTGHRIGLYHVVARHHEGLSAEQIVERYPTLTLGHVEKVLDFYLRHRDEVDAYVETERCAIELQSANAPPVDRDEVRRRVEARKRAGGR